MNILSSWITSITSALAGITLLMNGRVAGRFGFFVGLLAVAAGIWNAWSAIKPTKEAIAIAKAEAEAKAEEEAKAKAEAEAKAKAEAEAKANADQVEALKAFCRQNGIALSYEGQQLVKPYVAPSILQATPQQGVNPYAEATRQPSSYDAARAQAQQGATVQPVVENTVPVAQRQERRRRHTASQAAKDTTVPVAGHPVYPYAVPVQQGANPYAVLVQQAEVDNTVPVAVHPVYPCAVPAQAAGQVTNLAEGIEFPMTPVVEDVADDEEHPWYQQEIPEVPAATWRPRS